MSDTPRMDDAWRSWINSGGASFLLSRGCQLERELNATTQAFSDYMTRSTIEADELKHEIGNLRQHIELLRATK